MEWRSIRWTRAARLGGIAVGALAAIAVAATVMGSQQAPRLDRDIGLRVSTPAPPPAPAPATPRPAATELSHAVDKAHRGHRHQLTGEAKAGKPPAKPKPTPPTQAPEPPPAPEKPAPAPPPPVQTFPPTPTAAPAPSGGGGTPAQQEFGFED